MGDAEDLMGDAGGLDGRCGINLTAVQSLHFSISM